jgi:hypothetical protein
MSGKLHVTAVTRGIACDIPHKECASRLSPLASWPRSWIGELSCATDTRTARADELSPEACIRLQVTDTGRGMDRETVTKTFEPGRIRAEAV